MNIYEKAELIKDQASFTEFLKLLKEDLSQNRGDWCNDTLESFLEGMYGYSSDENLKAADWKSFAKILLAGRVYE